MGTNCRSLKARGRGEDFAVALVSLQTRSGATPVRRRPSTLVKHAPIGFRRFFWSQALFHLFGRATAHDPDQRTNPKLHPSTSPESNSESNSARCCILDVSRWTLCALGDEALCGESRVRRAACARFPVRPCTIHSQCACGGDAVTAHALGDDTHCETCICGRRAPVQRSAERRKGPGSIAWSEHLAAWSVYDARWRSGQSAERIAERGGFGWTELITFLGHEPKTWQPRAPHPIGGAGCRDV
jgi:hypothetical protein